MTGNDETPWWWYVLAVVPFCVGAVLVWIGWWWERRW